MLKRIARGLERRLRAAFRPAMAASSRVRGGAIRRTASLRATLGAFSTVTTTLARIAGRRIRRSVIDPRHPRPLRVGIDIRPFYEPLTGVGWYLRELLGELATRDDVELVLFGDAAVTEDGPRLHVDIPRGLSLSSFDLSNRSGSGRALASAAYPLWIWLEGCDVLFGANYFLPRPMSAVARRRVVTVHDFTYRRYPGLLQQETLADLEREMTREIARADAVICVSMATRSDLLALYPAEPSRIVAIHSGMPDVVSKRAPVESLPSRYLLFVSTIEPRKNLDVLLTAFESVRDTGRWDGDLVIAGRIGWKSDAVVHRMRTSPWCAAIHHLDYLSRAELATAYAGAEIFILPSHYEGFGFTLLEAMAHGVPSIAARTSSLPEVGGDAALYFDPTDAPALADRIAALAADDTLKRTLGEAGRRRAAGFRWQTTADRTLEVLRRAGGRQ